jgi:hypothetical protein
VESIRVIATCPRIPGDNVAEFKKAAARALDVAQGKATTLQYDWFFNDDETACVAFEAPPRRARSLLPRCRTAA